MKQIAIVIALFVFSLPVFSQKRYFTKSGHINFAAGTSVEDIDAINKAATSVFDAASGQIEFAVLVKGFEFKRALMQEHFTIGAVDWHMIDASGTPEQSLSYARALLPESAMVGGGIPTP